MLMMNLPCLIQSQSWVFLCWSNQSINKLISLVMQLMGGFIVLYSIDSNIFVLKKLKIFDLFKQWLRQCPLVKPKPIELKGSACVSISMSGAGSIRTCNNPETIEEKVEHLFKEIEWIKADHKAELSKIHNQISFVESSLDRKFHRNSEDLVNLNRKIDNSSLGGLKLQLFGVLLLFYGAICGFFS